MTTNPNDLDLVPEAIPVVERSDAHDLEQQSAIEPPPVRMTGFDRGRMTQAAVELMLRNVVD